MKRLISFLTILMLFASAAMAEPLTLADDLTGEYALEGVDYRFTIRLPQIAGESELAKTINQVYAMEMSEQLEFKAPIKSEVFASEGAVGFTDVDYRVTRNSDGYFCVVITSTEKENDDQLVIRSAHVFPTQGDRAGLVISLPYLLGLLDSGESDTWLQDRQTAKADECVRQLIWESIERQQSTGAVPYWDDLDYETFAGCFYPEEDFYMDEDGTLIFFVQAGFIAAQDAGILEWRFTRDELLDEL